MDGGLRNLLISGTFALASGTALVEVALHEVTKSFGGAAAVDRVSLAVPKGALVALLGPSGCGKSTTLRLIAGLEQPTAGRIMIGGRDVTDAAPADRGIAMVFQSYALFPHLSVAENIVFGLRVRNVPSAELKRRLDRAVDILGLSGLLERKPSQLSGGQQQRVALGRAIVAETPVCLMDEPLSNLDAQLRGDMRREIRALQQRLGITMIYVTHDQIEAMTMADRVALMRAGKVEQYGTPAELYDTPATIFTARFMGAPAMNVVPYSALEGHAPWVAKPSSEPANLYTGVRPEAVRIAARGLPATVTAVEYLGAESLIQTNVGQGSAGTHPFLARVAQHTDLAPGTPISLTWDAAATHHFDSATGRRIA